MAFKKTVSLIVSLSLLGLLVWMLFETARHSKVNDLRVSFKDKLQVLYENSQDMVNPARRAPLSTIELEERLKANLAVPFGKFSRRDWDWFWRLLYGRFKEDTPGWPKRVRQLSREEIQDNLIDYYYRPFASFGDKQWAIFWQQILKGQVFK